MRATFASVVVVLSLTCCTVGRDFSAQLKAYESDSRVAADLARRCASELRALAEHNPVETGRALADMATPFVSPTWIAPEGSWSEIARREREFEAIRNTIAGASADEPAAVYRAATAAARARHLQAGLCRARDVAATLVSMARPVRIEQPAVADGARRRP